MDDELLPIGRFARLSGLTIGALRHYDELALLQPAEIDGATGYRRYRTTQLEMARTIGRLRDLEMPLDEIRAVLASDDPNDQRARIEAHRRRVEARTLRLQRELHALGRISAGKEPIVSTASPTTLELDEATHRRLGKELYNATWELLERADRSAAETDELIHRAHASRWHWGRVGEPANLARGEWLCCRVYATLGRAEPARWHARRCLEVLDEHGIGDWDRAAAYEANARAALVAGDAATARDWAHKARTACEAIEDPDDADLIRQDLDGLSLD